MHDGPDPAAIQAGDLWLQNELPKILNSAAYQGGTTAVFVTFRRGRGVRVLLRRGLRDQHDRRVVPRRDDRDQPLHAARHGLGATLQPLLAPEDDPEAARDPRASRQDGVGAQHATAVQALGCTERERASPATPQGGRRAIA